MIWDVAGRFFFFKIFPEVFPSSFSLKNYFRLILYYFRFTDRLNSVEKIYKNGSRPQNVNE